MAATTIQKVGNPCYVHVHVYDYGNMAETLAMYVCIGSFVFLSIDMEGVLPAQEGSSHEE